MEKGKVMMIIIIVLLVVLLGTVAAVSIYVLNLINNQAVVTQEGGAVGGTNSTKTLTVEEKTTVALGEAITTNLQPGEDGKAHIAKILVSLSYDNTAGDESDAFATLLAGNMAVAKSVALGVISDCTFDELSGPDGKEYLADIIKTRLQEEFNTMLIVDVVFEEWLIP